MINIKFSTNNNAIIMSDFKIRTAFITLTREVEAFLEKDIGSSLHIFGLSSSQLEDMEYLPMIIELAKDIISRVHARYGSNWDDFGWNYYTHAKIISEQIEILEPLAKEMINEESLDLPELIKKVKPAKVLPDGIDYNKYKVIIDELTLPNSMFQFIFVSENILRIFIIKVLKDNGFDSIQSLGIFKLNKNIISRKNEEKKRKYLPIRGSHDIYYLDLSELKKIILNKWDLFNDKVISQSWISEKIDSFYYIRNRVAHNSGSLTKDELRSIETYSRELIKQIDPYIF